MSKKLILMESNKYGLRALVGFLIFFSIATSVNSQSYILNSTEESGWNVTFTNTDLDNNESVILAWDLTQSPLSNAVTHLRMGNDNSTYVLDENSTNNNDAEINGPTDVVGWMGRGKSFDGSNDNLNITYSSSMDVLDNNDSFTFAVWFKPDALPGAGIATVFAQTDGTGTGRIWTFIVSADDTIRVGIGGGKTTSVTAVVGSWHFVVVSYDGTDLTVYVDDVLKIDEADTVDENADGSYYVGSDKTGTGGLFNGTIDEVMIFDRNLSRSDITGLYNNSWYSSGNITTKGVRDAGDGYSITNISCNSTSQPSGTGVNIYANTSSDNSAFTLELVREAATCDGTNYTVSATNQKRYYEVVVELNTTVAATPHISEIVIEEEDVTAPSITIDSPTNITYNSATFELNVSSAASDIDTWWYNLNSGSNTTFTPNTTVTAVNGSNTLIIYVNDTTGNENSSTVYFTIDAGIWWSSYWNYRKEIVIDNTQNTNELTNYEMEIFINSTYFNLTNINSNGSDIRFIDNDSVTELNYWLENDNKLFGYSYPSSPIAISLGSSGEWDEKIREIGNILYEPTDTGKEYKIFYSGYNGTYTGLTYIGYAYSSDAITWTKHSTKVTDFYAEDPYVVKNGSTYYMYYEIKDGVNKDSIGLATTTNIENNFTESIANPVVQNESGWDVTLAGSPVVWIEDSYWHMIYEGVDSSDKGTIGYANSTNESNWVKYGGNPLISEGATGDFDENGVVSDDIIKIGDTYNLFYHTLTSIYDVESRVRGGIATSTDKLTWAQAVQNPVSYWRAAMPVKGDDDWLIFAGANGTTDAWGIGRASMGFNVYVKIPTIPASANKTIYMYYGRVGATTTSNITSTFLDSDDFEYTDTITNHGWVVDASAPSGSNSTSSDINKTYDYSLKLNDSNTTSGLDNQNVVVNSIPDQTGTFIIEFYVKQEQRDAVFSFMATNGTNQIDDWEVGLGIHLSLMSTGEIAWSNGTWQTISDYTSNRWYHFKLIVNVTDTTYDIYIDDVLRNSSAEFRDATISRISDIIFRNAGGSQTGVTFIDGVKVRKYNATVPTYSTSKTYYTNSTVIYKDLYTVVFSTGVISYNDTIAGKTKINMTVVPSSNNVSLTVFNWTTSYKKWNESSSNSSLTTNHTVGDFTADTKIAIKTNETFWNYYTSNSSGYITFNYDGGYSDVQFEAEPDITAPILFTNLSNTSYAYRNFTIWNNATDTNLDTLWHNNGTDNITYQTANHTFTINYTSDGQYNITFYANDTLGNLNETRVVFTVDTTYPQIYFVSPTPDDAEALSSGTTAITINISITETNNNTLILNWMGVNTSYTSTTPYWSTTKTVGDGNEYYAYAWINDTAGNFNQTSTITFSVDQPVSSPGTGGTGTREGTTPLLWTPIIQKIEVLDNTIKLLGVDVFVDNMRDWTGTEATIKYTLSTLNAETLDQGGKIFRILPKKTTHYIIYPETNYLGEVSIFVEIIKDNKTVTSATKLFKTTGNMVRGDFFTIPESIQDRIIVLDTIEKIYTLEANKKVRQCSVDNKFFKCIIIGDNKISVSFNYNTVKWKEELTAGVVVESVDHERILVPITIDMLTPKGDIELENPIMGIPENKVTNMLLTQKDGEVTGIKLTPILFSLSGLTLFGGIVVFRRWRQ